MGINYLYSCDNNRTYFRPFTLLVVGKMNQRIITGRKNKYRNKKTVVDGFIFDSRKESQRYAELRMLESAGKISGLFLQPKFEIIPSVKWNGKKLSAKKYIADFFYAEKGQRVIEDVKGIRTPAYILKRQLFLIRYPEYVFKEI